MDVAPTPAILHISRIENLSIFVNPEFGLCHGDSSFESDSTCLESNHELFSDERIPSRASRKLYLTAAGIRTRDLRISRTMLYRLSYKVKAWHTLV